MIKSVAYKFEHACRIELNEAYEGQAQAIDAYKDVAGFVMESVIHERTGEVLAIFSGTNHLRGNFEISALIGLAARKYPIQFFRHTQRRIQFWFDKPDIRRVQTTIRCGYPFLEHWILLLGFTCEGRMRKFGPEGDDYYLYARVK